jgi:hypothetical protein
MKINKILAVAIVLAGLLAVLRSPLTLLAQDQDQGPGPDQSQEQAPSQDPPSRVARLNFSDGSVSFQPGGEGDWVQAVPNRPLTTGDNLWADKDSRAELHVGSTAIRIDSETSVTFLDLDDHTLQLKLSQGSVIVRLRHLDDGDTVEVDTPNLAFSLLTPGEYRVDVNADGSETDTRVWHGRGEATGGGASYAVVAGQNARFTGNDQLDHQIEQLPRTDDFDNFAFARDQREDHSESANYISPEVTGYEDLDEHGHWHYVADYGPVWTPSAVAVGWAPYRYGHWVWVEPWGWTWVEDEPWGFAPFHYGRWAYVQSSWCWVPGPVVVRPVYAPALVAFIGGGGAGFAIGVGSGVGVGWFPLGPREVFVPWYRGSREYVNNVNITNTRVNVTQVTSVYNNVTVNKVTNITYVNQHVSNSVTVVSRDTFVNARPVAANVAHVDERQLAAAPVTHQVQVQPVRASVLGPGAPARFKPAAGVVNRQVVATRMPTPPKEPFEQRQAKANVRTVTPSQPQPAARGQNEAARPQAQAQAPAPRGQNEAPRPQAQAPAARPEAGAPTARMEESRPVPRPPTAGRPEEAPQPSRAQEQAPRPQEQARPQEQGRTLEQAPRPQEQARPQQAQPTTERVVPRPQNTQPAHPLVRQAPPVQERPQHEQNEAQKFNQWQQQRPQPASAPRPPQRSTPPPPKDEKKK